MNALYTVHQTEKRHDTTNITTYTAHCNCLTRDVTISDDNLLHLTKEDNMTKPHVLKIKLDDSGYCHLGHHYLVDITNR